MFPNLSSFRTDYIYVLPVFVFVLELKEILLPTSINILKL
jgi:hypothetical protein